MTTGDAALDHLRECATTGRWDAAAAHTLVTRLPDPDQLLTKDHLDLRLRAELAEVRSELRTEIAQLGADLRGEIAQLGTDLRSEMADDRAENLRSFTALQDEMGRRFDAQTKWMVGSFLAFAGIMATSMAAFG